MTMRLRSMSEIVACVERLSHTPCRTTGAWSLAQIVHHLAAAIDASIDEQGEAPSGVHMAITPLLRALALWRGLPRGVKMAPALRDRLTPPPGVELTAAMESLRRAVQRAAAQPMTAMHPVLGTLSSRQWEQFHLRHAELHLSYVVQGAATAPAPARA